jgi:hypothetical protein
MTLWMLRLYYKCSQHFSADINKHNSSYNEHFALNSYSIQATHIVQHTLKRDLSEIK